MTHCLSTHQEDDGDPFGQSECKLRTLKFHEHNGIQKNERQLKPAPIWVTTYSYGGVPTGSSTVIFLWLTKNRLPPLLLAIAAAKEGDGHVVASNVVCSRNCTGAVKVLSRLSWVRTYESGWMDCVGRLVRRGGSCVCFSQASYPMQYGPWRLRSSQIACCWPVRTAPVPPAYPARMTHFCASRHISQCIPPVYWFAVIHHIYGQLAVRLILANKKIRASAGPHSSNSFIYLVIHTWWWRTKHPATKESKQSSPWGLYLRSVKSPQPCNLWRCPLSHSLSVHVRVNPRWMDVKYRPHHPNRRSYLDQLLPIRAPR